MELIDTHCHLNHSDYDTDRDDVLQRAFDAKVMRLLVIGFDLISSRFAAELSQKDGIFAAVGIHPESADEWGDETKSILQSIYSAEAVRIAAYGEIGLDYHWESVPRSRQKEVFADQIEFAATLASDLALVIHCREAQDDVLAVLKESNTRAPIIMHCFGGNIEYARQCLEAGCYLGIGGVATFKKSAELREAIAFAPLDKILLETDCPYLAPQPWRGKRNEPSYITIVAQLVADCKGISIEDVAATTTANARRILKMA
jgi:TatD DNase family protein